MLINLEPLDKKLLSKFTTWKSIRDAFLSRANIAKEYFLNDVEGTGTTYTQRQYEKIMQTTGLDISFNILYPIISQKLAILNQSKYSFKVLPINDEAKQVAHIINKLKDMILYSSNSNLETREAIKEYLITGITHIGWVKSDYVSNDALFGIKLIHYPLENIVLDPNFKRPDSSDMRGYFTVKKISSEVFEKNFQPYLDIINDYYKTDFKISDIVSGYKQLGTNIITTYDETEVELIDYYDKRIAELLIVKDPATGNIKRIFRENLFPEQFEIITSTYEIIDKQIGNYVRCTKTANGKVYEVYIEETEEFLIKTLFMEWGGTPYKSKGMASYLVPMQDTLDKIVQQMLFNAMLLNTGGIIAPIGSIPDELLENWKQNASNPSAIKFYVPQHTGTGEVLIPQRENIPQLPNHYLYLIELIRNMMESTTGITPTVTGDVRKEVSEVFSTNQLLQNAAMHRIIDNSTYINTIFESIGKALIQLLPSLIDPNKYLYFFDEKAGDFNELQITQEQLNSIVQAKFRLIAIPSESTPIQKMATAKDLMNIAQTTQNPFERDIFIKEAYKLLNIRGFNEIQQQIDTVKNLQTQLEEYQNKEQRFQELMKQMENRVINAELKSKILESEMKAIIDIEKAKIATEKDLQYESLTKSSEFKK